jgi:hypothetical protein
MPVYPFRVFISYAHENLELAAKLGDYLEGRGLVNLWDRSIDPGKAFTEEIKQRILCSHLFLLLITKESIRHPWVHQETGFALGKNVPVMPIAVGSLPDEMIRDLHAVQLGEDLAGIDRELTDLRIERAVAVADDSPLDCYTVVDHPERRIELSIAWARRVRHLSRGGKGGCVRQWSAYSLFNIPPAPPNHPLWQAWEGDRTARPDYRARLWDWRREMEGHVSQCGCRLMIDPSQEALVGVGPEARRVRLRILRDFLNSVDDQHARVAFYPREDRGYLLIVGDWFMVRAVSPRKGIGWMQASFTWHAPTVLRALQDYEKTFSFALGEQHVEEEQSRLSALRGIDEMLREDDRQPDGSAKSGS